MSHEMITIEQAITIAETAHRDDSGCIVFPHALNDAEALDAIWALATRMKRLLAYIDHINEG